MASPDSLLKICLDELRMQMLGTQVAFGFLFQSLFQERLDVSTTATQRAMSVGLAFIVLTLALLITAPAVHRIAAGGGASERVRHFSSRLARLALITLSVSLSATVFVSADVELGRRGAWISAVAVAIVSMLAWQAWGVWLRSTSTQSSGGYAMSQTHTHLHDKIDHMLTEARVILPGAQALVGFQLLVILMEPFAELPGNVKLAHFVALSFITLAIVLLISPAAIHRISFSGDDDARFERIGSRIVTSALAPLAIGIAAELYVAASRLLASPATAGWIAAIATCVLLGFWYVLPLALRATMGRVRNPT